MGAGAQRLSLDRGIPPRACSPERATSTTESEVRPRAHRPTVSVWVRLFLTLGLWIAGLGLSAAPAPISVESHDLPETLSSVLGIERAADADVLLLRSGDKLTGTVSNEAFHLRTAHGTIRFARRVIAGLELAAGAYALDLVITVNNDRFTGFLEDPALTFQLPSSQPSEIRREKIAKAILRLNPTERAGIPRNQFVQLKNGDVFTGRTLLDRLQLTTPAGPVSFAATDFESLRFISGKSPTAELITNDGTKLTGSLDLEDLEFQLDVGPKLRVYQERIQILYGRAGFTLANLNTGTTRRSMETNPAHRSPAHPEGLQIAGLVWIPPGEFMMGSPSKESDRDLDEGPQTKVLITQGFWMARCEVTQAEYESVLESNPSQYTGDPRRPVEKVSWHDALRYCARLNQIAQISGSLPAGYWYRLPTEAEWEYACRAGSQTRFYYGDDPVYLRVGDYAWFNGNSSSGTHPVGTKLPNPWGLHDMHGNVLEWCLDGWSGALPGGTSTNAPAPPAGSLRVARGGSWLYEAKFSRSANRDDYSPSNQCSDLGFRVVLAPSGP